MARTCRYVEWDLRICIAYTSPLEKREPHQTQAVSYIDDHLFRLYVLGLGRNVYVMLCALLASRHQSTLANLKECPSSQRRSTHVKACSKKMIPLVEFGLGDDSFVHDSGREFRSRDHDCHLDSRRIAGKWLWLSSVFVVCNLLRSFRSCSQNFGTSIVTYPV
jgi:hypothetical protein